MGVFRYGAWSGLAILHAACALKVSPNASGTGSANVVFAVPMDKQSLKRDSGPPFCRAFSLIREECAGDSLGDETVQAIASRSCSWRPSGPIELVIGVTTNSAMHQSRAHRHFSFHRPMIADKTMLMYFTNGDFEGGANTHKDHRSNLLGQGTQRVLDAWRYIGSGCLGAPFRWYLQVDDDTAFSVPRIQTFLRAAESKLGGPEEESAVIGKFADWSFKLPSTKSPCGHLFGGTGLLATYRATVDMANLGPQRWADASDEVHWGDATLSELIYEAKCDLIRMESPFGLGVNGVQDEVKRGFWRDLSNTSTAARAVLSMHKVTGAAYDEVAEPLFEREPVTEEVYAELVEKAGECRKPGP